MCIAFFYAFAPMCETARVHPSMVGCAALQKKKTCTVSARMWRKRTSCLLIVTHLSGVHYDENHNTVNHKQRELQWGHNRVLCNWRRDRPSGSCRSRRQSKGHRGSSPCSSQNNKHKQNRWERRETGGCMGEQKTKKVMKGKRKRTEW